MTVSTKVAIAKSMNSAFSAVFGICSPNAKTSMPDMLPASTNPPNNICTGKDRNPFVIPNLIDSLSDVLFTSITVVEMAVIMATAAHSTRPTMMTPIAVGNMSGETVFAEAVNSSILFAVSVVFVIR